MKKIRLEIEQKEINEHGDKQFEISLYDGATIIDAIIEVDKLISARGKFPTEKIYSRTKMKCYSLLHMVYNPLENRMYQNVLVSESTGPEMSIKIKYKPELILPDGLTVTIILKSLCGDEAPEELVDYEGFRQTMLKKGYKIS
jgi:hypothetical protein